MLLCYEQLQQTQGLERCLQAVMDTVISRTMEALYQMYSAFKKNTPLPQMKQSEALQEIRNRTDALVSPFSSVGKASPSDRISFQL